MTDGPVAHSPHTKHAKAAWGATTAALEAVHREKSDAAERVKESRTLRAALEANGEQ